MRIAGTSALLSLALVMSTTSSAFCADPRPFVGERPPARIYVLPFPRSERAQSVWESGACWSECGAYCTWGQAACLRVDTQGQCLAYTDACDRSCQKTCRTSGGPLLNITD